MQPKHHVEFKNKCLYVNDRCARGLLHTLKSCFYPYYRFQKVDRTKRRKGNPKNIGKWMDFSIMRLTKGLEYGFADHPGRKRIESYLARHEFIPVASQVNVGCPELRLATRLDLLCQNKQDEYVIFEIKTGFEGYYEHCTERKMNLPFYFCSDAPHWQHQLQLYVSLQLFRLTYPDAKVAETGHAVLLIQDKLNAFPLAMWNDTIWQSCRRKLLETVEETRADRRAIIRNSRRKRKRS